MRAAVTGAACGIAIAATLVATPPARAEPAPDLTRAAELYAAAEAAMADGRFADALRDFGAAYDVTKDPILFYKLGSANERAGKCDAALIAFGRYLAEAHPAANFAQLARDHIRACGGDPDAKPPAPEPTPEPPAPPAPVSSPPAQLHGHGTWPAWVLAGSSLGLVTIGAVMAYATSSSERDLEDLYAGVGNPPKFNATTQQRYQQLLDLGHRYEVLSWTAFGLAGAAAIGAGILFATHHDERAMIVPVVAPNSAGVSLVGHF